MSDFATTFNALRAKLQEFTTLPIYWPNDSRTPTLKDAPSGYVYSEIRVQDEAQIELGSSATHRDTGELEIWVMVPRGTQTGTAETYAQTIRALFGVSNVSGVIVNRKIVEPGRIVPTNFGRMYCVPIRIDWWADRLE
jgi:hypothetical protein